MDRKAPWWSDESGPRNPFAPGGTTVFTASAVDVNCVRVLEGRGDFPVDMLKYDRAFCMTPIPHPSHPWFAHKYRVVVGFAKRFKPTTARWESFSFKVIPAPFTPQMIATLKGRVRSWQGTCHRCVVEAGGYAVSYFNIDLLCAVCEQEERQHPDFDVARNTLRHAFARHDYGFNGVGWPGHHGHLP